MNMYFAALTAIALGCALWLAAILLDKVLSPGIGNILLAIGAIALAFGICWGACCITFGA